LAIKYHPDKNLGNEEKSKLEFIAIGEAYEKCTQHGEGPLDKKGYEYY